MSNKLITENAEHLLYDHGILEIAVLGGIRLEGLDRMRVTLKISVEHLTLRHNLDLYNDTQVEKLIRKVAEKLEVGTSVTASAVNELTNLLEEYRLIQIEQEESSKVKTYALSSTERAAAEMYLKAPNLMTRTKEDIGRSGVVGEEDNRLLMYLIFTSRKMATPLHIVSLGSSGVGKTHLQEKVGELIPEEDTLSVTSLSENAFYYFERTALSHKLLLIEDLDGAENVLYPLRELQSKKRISKTIVHKNTRGETRSVTLEVEGPVCVAGCTTKERIYEDNANRSFLLYLDESQSQTDLIMDYQRALSAGKVNTTEQHAVRDLLKNTQRILQPIKVVNPYAESLCLPKAVFKPRRTNAHYLHFIEAVTFYHQLQREQKKDEQTGELYIETSVEDIEEANKLMKHILLHKSDELSGACRNYFEALKVFLVEEEKTEFMNREIRGVLRIAGTTLRRYHTELLDAGYIEIVKGKKNTGYTYRIVDAAQYERLKSGIDTVLDEMVSKIALASKPAVSHTKNGSPKANTANKKKAVSR